MQPQPQSLQLLQELQLLAVFSISSNNIKKFELVFKSVSLALAITEIKRTNKISLLKFIISPELLQKFSIIIIMRQK